MADEIPIPEPGDVWAFRFADKREAVVHALVKNRLGVVHVVFEYTRTAEVTSIAMARFRESYRPISAAAVPS